MTGVDADLATLRHRVEAAAARGQALFPNGSYTDENVEGLAALARVKAELSRLREERDALRAKLTTPLDAPTEYDLTGREGE